MCKCYADNTLIPSSIVWTYLSIVNKRLLCQYVTLFNISGKGGIGVNHLCGCKGTTFFLLMQIYFDFLFVYLKKLLYLCSRKGY